MKEVQSPKKSLFYYYGIALVVLLLFNLIVAPLLAQRRVTEIDYGAFMKMIEEKNIGEVKVEDYEIVFTDKDNKNIYIKPALWTILI